MEEKEKIYGNNINYNSRPNKSLNTRIKFFIIILATVLFTFSIYTISQTYSKYISSADGSTEAEIAKWHIYVNNTHITSGTDISNTIEPVFPGNEHIREGIIAPTSEGYFDLDLDFEEVDVSFKYQITLLPNVDNVVDDLIVSGYSFDEGVNILSFSDETVIEETIELDSIIEERSIRIYIKWSDDDLTETMDNDADTIVTTDEDNRALVDVSVEFTQITE